MRRIMTIETLRRSGDRLLHHIIMGRFFVKLRGLSVAIKADSVVVGLAHLDREFVTAGGLLPDMPQARFLGLNGAKNSVVGVAPVALLALYVAILIMQRCHRLASRVLQVVNER